MKKRKTKILTADDIRLRLLQYKHFIQALKCMSFCVLEEIIYNKHITCSLGKCRKSDMFMKDLYYRVLK